MIEQTRRLLARRLEGESPGAGEDDGLGTEQLRDLGAHRILSELKLDRSGLIDKVRKTLT